MAAVSAGVRIVTPKVHPPLTDGVHPLDEQAFRLARIGHGDHLSGSDPEGRSDEQPVSRFEGGKHAGAGHHDAAEPQRPELD